MEDNILSRLLEEKEMKLKGGVYYYTQIKFAYNSNKIEGSTLTEDETRFIYDTNSVSVLDKRVLKIDDIVEAKNHFRCFDFMLESSEKELSENIIKECHRLLKSGTSDSEKGWFNVGGYKTRENTVANIMTTPASNVEEEMKKLIAGYVKKEKISIEDIIDFHYKFEKIHPFQDGNGRVGRLIMFKECLKNNIVPFVIYDENKQSYYWGLKEYEKTKKHLNDVCLHEQEKYSVIMDYFKINYDEGLKRERPGILSEKQVVEVLLANIVNKCKELEKKNNNQKRNVYFDGYYEEIKKTAECIYNFMNNGEIDKNYRDKIMELKAVCKMKEKELIGKEDLLSKGSTRALLDLEIGFNNTLRMMSGEMDGVLFAGIDLNLR